MTSVLVRDIQREKRRPPEDGGRDWSDAVRVFSFG